MPSDVDLDFKNSPPADFSWKPDAMDIGIATISNAYDTSLEHAQLLFKSQIMNNKYKVYSAMHRNEIPKDSIKKHTTPAVGRQVWDTNWDAVLAEYSERTGEDVPTISKLTADMEQMVKIRHDIYQQYLSKADPWAKWTGIVGGTVASEITSPLNWVAGYLSSPILLAKGISFTKKLAAVSAIEAGAGAGQVSMSYGRRKMLDDDYGIEDAGLDIILNGVGAATFTGAFVTMGQVRKSLRKYVADAHIKRLAAQDEDVREVHEAAKQKLKEYEDIPDDTPFSDFEGRVDRVADDVEANEMDITRTDGPPAEEPTMTGPRKEAQVEQDTPPPPKETLDDDADQMVSVERADPETGEVRQVPVEMNDEVKNLNRMMTAVDDIMNCG